MPRPHTLAMSPSGRFVAMRRPGALEVVDVLGTAPRRTLPLDGGEFAIAGTTLCLVDEGGLRAVALEGPSPPAQLAMPAAPIRVFHGRAADAILVGATGVALSSTPAPFAAFDPVLRWFPLLGRAVMNASPRRAAIVIPSRPDVEVPVRGGLQIRDAAPLFAGRLIAILGTDDAGELALVVTAAGAIVHRVRVPASTWHAFAIDRGLLLLGPGDDQVIAVDLRYGRILGTGKAPHAIAELVIDDDGRSTAFASLLAGELPIVSLVRLDEILRSTGSTSVDGTVVEADVSAPAPPVAALAPLAEPIAAARPPATPPPELLPLAFGKMPRVRELPEGRHVDAFSDGAEHLDALLDLVAARAALAIADAWHVGRISADGADQLPFEREVLALAGAGGGYATTQLTAARDRVTARAERVSQRVRASVAAGIHLPFLDLAHEHELTANGTQVLLAVLAPRARGELARLYRILSNETDRPRLDDALLVQLLGGAPDPLLAEIADHAPLISHGLVVRDARGGLDIDEALIARLRGWPIARSAAALTRYADRTLDELVVDREALHALVLATAEPRPADQPIRVVIRGRRGAGRHTMIATLAARIDHAITCIDVTQLPRGPGQAADLRRELARAFLWRTVPVVSGLELGDAADPDASLALRQVIRMHPGPVVVRTTRDAAVPLDPGYVEIELPPLTETERHGTLAGALAAAGITADVARLAQRYRIGPGVIARVVAQARDRLAQTGGEPTTILDEVARQHVSTRVGSSAQRVTRLATWDQVALPEDMLDSLRELVGRARHNRTVFEDWGYESKIATARGLTALFYGPPGTGKTMVAGLLARELGLELYRIDLAKVMSKWVGETEKNLGEVFDAAEDGRLMLLFDEADSLFARRTEVKSTNDRYANLEVNYLLQRLDAFEGVAILTTNLDGSIDPAFKRRLSMRLYFPFPDEEIRTQLWASHITSQIPTTGTLDFAALARRFPLSGGYIRNSALRAAFLAAQEMAPLSQAHLERAVLLEYRELGKLAEDGRME